jgi:hypothetical protein
MELKEDEKDRKLIAIHSSGMVEIYQINLCYQLKKISSIKVEGNIRTTKIMRNYLFLTSLSNDFFVVCLKNKNKPKIIKKIEDIFKCGGLNNCFDVCEKSQFVLGYNRIKSENLNKYLTYIKTVDLNDKFRVSKTSVKFFAESYIFKFLQIKDSIMICDTSHLIEIETKTLKLKRKVKFKNSGAILMDTSKDEELLFVTTNSTFFHIFTYSRLELLRKIKVNYRFVSLSFPINSKFIFGSLDSNLPFQYGKIDHLINEFK